MNASTLGAALLRFAFPLRLTVVVALLAIAAFGQSPNGTISGLVLDPSGRAISGADIQIANDATGVRYSSATNGEGIYAAPNLPPGPYRIQVSKVGFKSIIKPDIVLNVQSALAINFTLPIGALMETVTVEGGAPLINTTDASVSTVVDRKYVENAPLNGRSFQALIQLTPGVVAVSSNASDSGQFSVNGQRAVSNYWMVDGVSANIGVGVSGNTLPGNGLGGVLGSFSTLGGTNSLVSVDAMQEFRILTSTYAPEFGRAPGAQISIVTRSGTNQFHGNVFDYFRNDALDANNWFADEKGLPKPRERQNDFGGIFSGPILKDKTFFFFSYEGLRLQLPETRLTTVPDLQARQNAILALQPYLSAFPLPNGFDDATTGIAQFNATFTNRASLDAYSIRIDHKIKNLAFFGRYNYSPSDLVQRGAGVLASSLNTVSPVDITTQTATAGADWAVNWHLTNDLRFNYSQTQAASRYFMDDFGGAKPLASLPFPSPYTVKDALFVLDIFSLQNGAYWTGQSVRNLQRQFNIVDGLSMQSGSHSLKFGVDLRRLSPQYAPQTYFLTPYFADVPSAENGSLIQGAVQFNNRSRFLFRNFGAYAQDTWRVVPRLTVTYGLRWDLDFVPQSNPALPAVTGFNLNNLSDLALASVGTPPYQTKYGNIAPRLGVAYQARQSQDWQSVIRGGIGLFYDLASSEAGNNIPFGAYPFGSAVFNNGATFPLSAAELQPPPVDPSGLSSGLLNAYDPNLRLPSTLEWNVAFEQALGKQQTLSMSYLGAIGRRLLQTSFLFTPNPNFGFAQLVTNSAHSNYDAMQIQFQRQLDSGLQVLASYSWSHSIDTASAGSAFGNLANALAPSIDPRANRGPSDFDIRNAFSAGLTYDVPTQRLHGLAQRIASNWSLQGVIQARSAPPVDISDVNAFELSGADASVRPDFVPGQAFYLLGSQYPGGKALNPAAFTDPPIDPATGMPLRQGNVPRNFLRGFGATQLDFAVHRNFRIHESLKLQFRVEMFNAFNHPNFGQPNSQFGSGGFGVSSQLLGENLAGGNLGGGGFSPQYQIGGPRSIQLALKLSF